MEMHLQAWNGLLMLSYHFSAVPNVQIKHGLVSSQGRHFNFFLGGGAKFFFIFQCHRTIEKLENSTLYVVIWRYS